MAATPITYDAAPICDGVPMPIVKLNRWMLVVGIVAAALLQQPLITTILFLILLPTPLGGQRWSLVARTGRALLARQIATAPQEDSRLMRFNNAIAVILLGGAQIAFLLGAPVVGWVLAGMVAAAAAIALAGFCVGCFLYFQFQMRRNQLSNARR
jgi:hypothetical protein